MKKPDRFGYLLGAELLELAVALEQSANPDPTGVALIHELRRHGCSPLCNLNVPVDDLPATLTRAYAEMVAQHRSPARPQRDATHRSAGADHACAVDEGMSVGQLAEGATGSART